MMLPRITNNLVLILPDENFDKIGSMKLADMFDPAKRVSVRGRVLVLPNSLVCDGAVAKTGRMFKGYSDGLRFVQQVAGASLEMDTDIELEVGDEVAFRYVAHLNAKEDNLYWELGDGRKAIFMDYDTIYMAIRGDGYKMINGWMLIEPIGNTLDDIRAANAGLARDVKDMSKDGTGVVRHIGKPTRGYKLDYYQDVEEIKVGDVVHFPKSLKTPIEWSSHKTLNDGAFPYIRLQRKDIIAIE